MSIVIWVAKLKCVGNFKFFVGALITLVATPVLCMSSNSLFAHQMIVERATVHRVMFVPNDNIKTVLLGLIEAEKDSVIAALYRLSDIEIIQALIDAHKRKVHVEVVIDPGCLAEKTQKIGLLKKNGIPVYVRTAKYLMHNKFFLFSRNMYNKAIIWSGSANCTTVGMNRNCENVIVWENGNDFGKYRQQFERLKKESSLKSAKKKCVKRLW